MKRQKQLKQNKKIGTEMGPSDVVAIIMKKPSMKSRGFLVVKLNSQ
ncbi:hypothetical protein M3589_09530 [Heyndrickxia oleronia]|nr:hypothetical protein [Heyndrickxia oleronia]MCM3237971.1 hypothetical protein [Heyndrickxia oleronia]